MDYSGGGILFVLIMFVWYAIIIVQQFLAIGTAYRKAKANGDNGVSFFGWNIVYSLAALIPYLGFHLWKKSKEPGFK